jgi:hypothetical protein
MATRSLHGLLRCPSCDAFHAHVHADHDHPVTSRAIKWVSRDFFKRGPAGVFVRISGAANGVVLASIAAWMWLAVAAP